ncbi:MAG: hypothetical protein ABI813_09800 [Bacteroidota bacterium]
MEINEAGMLLLYKGYRGKQNFYREALEGHKIMTKNSDFGDVNKFVEKD